MALNLDAVIFVAFLIANLGFGLYYGRGITTIRSFAVGDKDFSTATLVSTIVATWISGSFFFYLVSESYTQGLSFILAVGLGHPLYLLIVGLLFAPRMAEFLGNLSVAEAMGNLFGRHVRTITAISGAIGIVGMVSVQLRVAGIMFEYALGIQGVYGVIFAGIIITLYSSFGGIKSVTFTDVVQFITFGVVIPTLAYFLFYSVNNDQLIIDTLTTNPLFDYKSVFDFSSPATYYTIFLFLFFITPSFSPAIFQRIAMAKDVKQVRNSFTISALACVLLTAIISWVAVLVLTISPGLAGNDVFKFIITEHNFFIGFKGFILAGVMAMVMSTVDSYINSTSVLLIHDLHKTLGFRLIKSELFTTRICSLLIGIAAIFFTMFSGSFLQLMIWALMFYMPVVTAPLILAIFGFRSSGKSVLLAMGAGFTMAMIWGVFLKEATGIDGVIPGMFANLIVLFASHYLLKQPGGWVGIKDPAPLLALREEHKQKRLELKQSILSFDLMTTLKKNTPKHDGFIAILGIFIMISNFSSIHTLPKDVQMHYAPILDVFFPVMLYVATGLISYPLWLRTWQKSNFLPVFWNAMVFFVLICFNFFTVLISNFSEVQLMVFMVNMIIVSTLITWRSALVYIVIGVLLTSFIYEQSSLNYQGSTGIASFEFKIAYLLLLVSGALLVFLKPKQEEEERNKIKIKYLEKEVDYTQRELANISQGVDFLENQFKKKEGKLHTKEIYLQEQLKVRNAEISKLTNMKDEFLRNITHESNAPLTGVISLCDVLYSYYDQLDGEKIKGAIKDIVNSGDRLKTYVNSIVDLSKLSSNNYKLTKESVNLGKLAEERTILYKKIFSDDAKKQEFIFDIENDCIVNCDKYYIKQTIDNLISNAVNYGNNKPVTIFIKQAEDSSVSFSISDHGIGIPKTELLSIFAKFSVSSRTSTPAGGRGVGLALCKSVIEAHEGSINAISNDKVTVFTFTLPNKV